MQICHLTCCEYFAGVTDRTLVLLADVFTGLKVLHVHGKGFTKETLLQLILSRKLVLDKVLAACDDWLLERMTEAKLDPMPSIWSWLDE